MMTVLRLLDALYGVICFFCVTVFFTSQKPPLFTFHLTLLFFVIAIIFHHAGIYRSWRFSSLNQEFTRLFYCCLLVVLTLITIAYAADINSLFPRKTILIFSVCWYTGIICGRFLLRTILHTLRAQGYNIRRAVIAGEGDAGRHLLKAVKNNSWTGVRILGTFSDEQNNLNNELLRLGTLDKLADYVQDENIDIVYLCLPVHKEKKITQLLTKLSDTGVSVHFIPDIFFYDLVLSSNIEFFDQIPVIGLLDTPIKGINALLKRSEDLIIASLILLISAPLLSIVAILIKISSSGTIFFIQWRYGLDGEPFRIYKFRTMTASEEDNKFRQTTRNDKRVTKIGYWLRRFSIDELPQLFNVLCGNMSMVGPRPHPIPMNEKYRKTVNGYMLHHKVKPGITGLAQLRGYRGETDTMNKIINRVESDLEYVRDWSLWLDIKIIFQTAYSRAWSNNAY